ncbi:hypothetical protein [Corynebacterium sp.]|uniref:hypothetical protein n=1 Tax=Corynebacterium sp. TaxID=1720 RepID=UPI0028ABE4D5|nr:hypothetical protein [Corynebacterium sp.]
MTTTTDLTALVREAAYSGITLRTSADRNDGTTEYIVNGPADSPAWHPSAEAAAADLTHRITSVQDAADAATRRAEEWQTIRTTAADDITAWRELAADVDALLPEGCTVPVPDLGDSYGLSGWPSMTGCVADALAQWSAASRDNAGRRDLDAALNAEGSVLLDSAEQLERRPDYWGTVVELWRPVQIVREPGDSPKLRQGRILADTDTRRNIAWRHFGVVTPVGRDEVDAAVEQITHAREVVAEVAERHRAEADRLAGKMHL